MSFPPAAVVGSGYFAVNVGEVYFRFYQFQDGMRQEVRFASHNSDQVILRHLRAQADSLGLPEAAGEVTLQRDGRHIEIESELLRTHRVAAPRSRGCASTRTPKASFDRCGLAA
jgi:hypothetical protein